MDKLVSYMTYLAGSCVLRSWPGIQLKGLSQQAEVDYRTTLRLAKTGMV
jgi:hypothetical protein